MTKLLKSLWCRITTKHQWASMNGGIDIYCLKCNAIRDQREFQMLKEINKKEWDKVWETHAKNQSEIMKKWEKWCEDKVKEKTT